jgi:endoglucanase
VKNHWRFRQQNTFSSTHLLVLAALLLLPACIMPGQKPALGNSAVALDTCADGLIDNGEDGNNQVVVRDGRNGYWYTFVDKQGSTVVPEAGENGGTFSMTPGGAHGSKYAANVHGKVAGGSDSFGGGVGVNFVDPKGPYDASHYNGLAFWARIGAGSIAKVRLKVPDVSTDPAGGVCRECFNDFGMDLTLTEAWQRFVFPFKKMRQLPDWGSPRRHSIDKSKLFGIQWQVNTPGAAFDIWIDDVEFVGCE